MDQVQDEIYALEARQSDPQPHFRNNQQVLINENQLQHHILDNQQAKNEHPQQKKNLEYQQSRMHLKGTQKSKQRGQQKASSFFRREWNAALRNRGFALQKQGYDNVLLKKEREPDGLQDTCAYIMRNPERAGLVDDWRDWPCLGSMIPGIPWIDAREEEFWPRFWMAYNGMRDAPG